MISCGLQAQLVIFAVSGSVFRQLKHLHISSFLLITNKRYCCYVSRND